MKKADLKGIEEKIKAERQQKFKESELPAKLTRTLYVSYGVGLYNAGNIDITSTVRLYSFGSKLRDRGGGNFPVRLYQ